MGRHVFSCLSLLPYLMTETNWLRFKLSLNSAINKNIPQAISKTQKHLPWLNSAIRKKMQK